MCSFGKLVSFLIIEDEFESIQNTKDFIDFYSTLLKIVELNWRIVKLSNKCWHAQVFSMNILLNYVYMIQRKSLSHIARSYIQKKLGLSMQKSINRHIRLDLAVEMVPWKIWSKLFRWYKPSSKIYSTRKFCHASTCSTLYEFHDNLDYFQKSCR